MNAGNAPVDMGSSAHGPVVPWDLAAERDTAMDAASLSATRHPPPSRAPQGTLLGGRGGVARPDGGGGPGGAWRRAGRGRGAAGLLVAGALLAMLAPGARGAEGPFATMAQPDEATPVASSTLDIGRYVRREKQGEQALAAALRERLRPGYVPEDVVALLSAEGFRCAGVNRTGIWNTCSYRIRVDGPGVRSVLVLAKVRRGPPPDFSVEFVPLKF